MEARENSNKISKLLHLRGEERLGVQDEVTAGIHATIAKLSGTCCVRVAFLQTIQKESWSEYNILLKIPKLEEHIKYLGQEFKELGNFLDELENTIQYEQAGISSTGIEEVDTTQPDAYYFLIYMIKDDRD